MSEPLNPRPGVYVPPAGEHNPPHPKPRAQTVIDESAQFASDDESAAANSAETIQAKARKGAKKQ